ncbi:TetR family transcriptional regulator C-terminal domain-containing protein [Paenibacillus sp. VMFN-D1]|uniref:TetR family transcriptional regulator C-terminal domain-containing protein n=1 Tax=Paenibacillus sp. VMFN-D1 TaxID=2135608 RepID=UPI002162D114|nr:TetR family transcriptional regulator C-terminal domain-containing protein [Paenibacillus sp. VMFN-D1]
MCYPFLHTFFDMMKSIIRDGIQAGEFREDLDVDALASFAFSLLEGGILLSKLDGDNKQMLTNITIFLSYLQQCCLKTR